jgi:RNA polymerase sigma-70 factor (ECF subfamily)
MALLPRKRAVGERHPGPADAAPSAFEDLAMPLLPSLYNLARWLSQNAADAEDLVQETFLKALRGFDSFEQGSNFKAWIFRILRNTYLTSRSGLAALRTVSLEEQLQQRSDSAHEIYPEAAIDRLTPEINVMRLADRAALESAMEKLPPLLLEAILLCDVEEMKYKEIASILDIPLGTVMSRIARARAHLRESLQPDAAQPGAAQPGAAQPGTAKSRESRA